MKGVFSMATAPSKLTHRLTLRLTEEDFDKLSYWAKKADMSIQDFVPEILSQYVDIANGNFELPTLEAKRVNQMVEQIAVLSKNVKALEDIVVHGFDSLLGLTRGDNYLLEEEDGDI